MAREDFRFFFPWRVRYAEIDAQAIVFFPRYLQYANIGWMEYWRKLGIPIEPARDAPVFNIVRTTVDYRKPMRLDEGIDIWVRCSRIGRTSMTTVFELHGAGLDDLRALLRVDPARTRTFALLMMHCDRFAAGAEQGSWVLLRK